MKSPGQRVLVVEDERHILRLIQVNLVRQGHSVETATTGAEALAKLATQPFDLAVIDSRLPDMTGHELIRQIRENPKTTHIRIIQIGTKDDRDADDPPGPDLFITNPFNPMQLLGPSRFGPDAPA